MTATTLDLPAILASHKLWLIGDAKGTRANLTGANLSGASLTRANLTGANLSGASLAGADLSGASLAGANLSGANLSGANLTRADLTRANLAGADLTRANLSGASLAGANLSGASLAGANLIVAGNRSDGYQFFGIKEPSGAIMVRAGCRYFSIAEARAHWAATRNGTRLGDESQALIDHIERMAVIAGWVK